MRLIDADALKNYIDCGHLRPPTELCFSELDVCNMIDKAPTIGGWIPCSERLPEEEGEYLIWCVSYDVTTGNKVTNTYGISYYDTQFEAWTGVHVGGFLWNEVTAWMPLPKPYEEETDAF